MNKMFEKFVGEIYKIEAFDDMIISLKNVKNLYTFNCKDNIFVCSYYDTEFVLKDVSILHEGLQKIVFFNKNGLKECKVFCDCNVEDIVASFNEQIAQQLQKLYQLDNKYYKESEEKFKKMI